MKTQNLKNSLMVLAAVVVIVVVSFGKTKAQSASDDAVLPVQYITNDGVAMEPVEMVKDNATEIKKWIKNELESLVKKSDYLSDDITAKVYIDLDNKGKITSYKMKENNAEFAYLLDNIIARAPRFEPVSMNGHNTKMTYEIPVKIDIR